MYYVCHNGPSFRVRLSVSVSVSGGMTSRRLGDGNKADVASDVLYFVGIRVEIQREASMFGTFSSNLPLICLAERVIKW